MRRFVEKVFLILFIMLACFGCRQHAGIREDIEIRDELAEYLGVEFGKVYTRGERASICKPPRPYYDSKTKKYGVIFDADLFQRNVFYRLCIVEKDGEEFHLIFEEVDGAYKYIYDWNGPSDAKIIGIAVRKSEKIRTSRNIGIGSSFGDVKNAYGGKGVGWKAYYELRAPSGYQPLVYLSSAPVVIRFETTKEDEKTVVIRFKQAEADWKFIPLGSQFDPKRNYLRIVSLNESVSVTSIIFFEDNSKYWKNREL